MVRYCLRALLVLVMCCSVAEALPFEPASTGETKERVFKDSFGRETPKSTVQGFLHALAQKDAELASKYLDDDYLNKKSVHAEEVVTRLQNNLDSAGRLLPPLQLSDDPEGKHDDLLPTDEDNVGVINQKAGAPLDIILIQKKDDEGNPYWQFSAKTLKALPKLSEHKPTLIEALSFERFEGVVIAGFDVADVLALALLVVFSTFVCYLIIWLPFSVIKALYPILTKRPFTITPKVIMPLAVVLVSLLLSNIMLAAGVPVTLRTPVGRLKEMAAWIATAWLVLRLIDAVFGRAAALSLAKNRPEQISLLGLLRKLAKVAFVILAMIIIFGNLGFDLTTGIAALGVGGIALAFGAQKTIENLIGSVMVVADRPINVGDYCKFGVYEGVVLDIGIRSTRVRTLNRTVVTIPNGDFSSLQIENYATRDMFHFLHNLYIKRNTDLDKLQGLIAHLKAFLDNHSDVNDEWTQVRISELRQDCFVVEVRAYIITTDVVVFYDKQTALAIELLKQVAGFGVEQALPSQTLYVDKAPAINN